MDLSISPCRLSSSARWLSSCSSRPSRDSLPLSMLASAAVGEQQRPASTRVLGVCALLLVMGILYNSIGVNASLSIRPTCALTCVRSVKLSPNQHPSSRLPSRPPPACFAGLADANRQHEIGATRSAPSAAPAPQIKARCYVIRMPSAQSSAPLKSNRPLRKYMPPPSAPYRIQVSRGSKRTISR